ncbi:MAG: glycosyltransferase family 2 protein [Candidatus Latescibacteria bacterium]|nr:glycosyltransferase family 2 protein [Candidatus Latescibacterota bacterium]
MKLSVIIPVYNEKDSVEKIINIVKAVPVEKEIIVVDDFSGDGTRDKLATISDIKLVLHEKNKGKGSAIRSGIKYAQNDIVIIQDADLEYDPNDYPKLLSAFTSDQIGAVFGSRFKGKSRFLLLSKLANYFLTGLTNLMYAGHISDMETCYKMVRRDILLSLNLTACRFEIEPEITCKLLRKKIRINEVPIDYFARTEGKKIGPKDAIIAIKEIFKWRF